MDCLPTRTREAMLQGISSNEIIVGAYTDREGRICPMLAAHRYGGRTALASFARAWDRYTGAGKAPRPASARELRTLSAMLETSLMFECELPDLAAEATAYRAATERRSDEPQHIQPRTQQPTGDRDRSRELSAKAGWAWLRIFRRYDDYAAAVAAAEEAESRSEDKFAGVN